MCKMGFLSFSLLVVWMFQLVSAQTITDPAEVAALNRMIDYWNLRTKLNLTVDPCTENAPWASEDANPRVRCDCTANPCHVTHLKIYALDIFGEIPSDLFLLRKLMDLNLGQNVLNGPIPAEIGELSEMQYLSLGINNLTGQVPPEIGNLTKLISLSFSSNNFFGSLPKELGNLTSLQQLYIDSSGVSGPIPEEFANLKSLQILWASDNLFTGKLPEFFGTFTELIDLRLLGTLLEGPIPSSFSALTKLTDLDLSFNKLQGQIPNSFQDFASLEYMYLGNNYLSGELPEKIISSKLIALNVVGTSVNAKSLQDGKAFRLLQCLNGDTKCSNKVSSSSFSVKSGGRELTSTSGIEFDNDSEKLEAASFYTSSDYNWAVSNTGNFISNPNGPQYIATTESQITATLDSELYKTARISPSSLRYYGLGLKNGKYSVDLHFAEIVMEDLKSWKGLGRRLFDVYIQGERVLQDFNIQKEAGGSKRALIKTFETNVTNTIMEIHFFWAGKGTCCIPFQGTYGPLVSGIHVSQVSTGVGDSESGKQQTGRLAGIVVGCVGGVMIISSIFYLWWTKESSGHKKVFRDSPKHNLVS